MPAFDDRVSEIIAAWGLDLSPKLEGFCDFLLSENEKYNLTAVRDKSAVAVRHMADSLFLLTCCDVRGKNALDVGCGAGFPGLPIKFCVPEMKLTAMDSTGKKTSFVKAAALREGVDVTVLTGRAEQLCVSPLRESFDLVFSRAVAELDVLCELCIPYLKPGGLLLSMKNAGDGELKSASGIIKTLGGSVRDRRNYTLPGVEGERQVIIIEKTAPTPAAYPRAYSKMIKKKKARKGSEK